MNWRQIYGDEAFIIKPPLYWSDYQRILERKKVNYEELKIQATEYAKMQCEILSVDYEDVVSGKCTVPAAVAKEAMDPSSKDQQELVKRENQESSGLMMSNGMPSDRIRLGEMHVNRAQQPPRMECKPESVLPKGWSTAKDSEGRIYYWHRETKQTQWEMPK